MKPTSDIISVSSITVVIVIIIIIVLTLLIASALVHAVGAERSKLGNVEALVGADALILEQSLVTVNVAPQVDVTLVGQLAQRAADGLAGRGGIADVEVDGLGEQSQGRNSQGDGVEGIHGVCVLLGWCW